MELNQEDAALFTEAVQHLRQGVSLLEELGRRLSVSSARDAVTHEVVCPQCEEVMTLRPGRFGQFYGCPNYPSCDYLIGAHTDGTPKGIPADQETRNARKDAHAAFDPLWRDDGIFRSRKAAYKWLSKQLGVDSAHMGNMDSDDCVRVVNICLKKRGLPEQGGVPIVPNSAGPFGYDDDVPF